MYHAVVYYLVQHTIYFSFGITCFSRLGPSFIKPYQLDPRIKDQLRNALLSTILPNFVSCGRTCPSNITQNLATVGAKIVDRGVIFILSLILGSSWFCLINVGRHATNLFYNAVSYVPSTRCRKDFFEFNTYICISTRVMLHVLCKIYTYIRT